ncbi:2-keto-4-pentenoate hydratase/2-oxohepta-3-ene-1,7-dioic acid hydratase in catechol pathway [Nitrospirillum amazonense]|uniref:2-keto-4-pentenoate hydratase/2-oxohepta-3-ene-1,7-dioic acid hydratase in catechol pathway n=1 Tax=Nitrospirillum amazonense TaxID=28077 RepID=A0A560FVN9_9PROT|nr:fumarylacetoacetate hydrolase family protein [Nitrospirillum amazonense]TWB18366.1 2-keto-4-pentenoate hydratase/2-oxohepta-3-ene-1,7-dioic acid hydratase in catechol pathway [Nitrospirillum amazonense]TWB25707.1 2-keto-4-pentenoate hydratase/2-oxohepta-3-ene-1,7-dioic acid hydratase in catechol pathway [Nitrospirillum amazonense]TWB66113.1 2-keto-4-pentenoate hydratase/2-oxohepta-3-ene-1,7-dioic acid hydratase in catechol pathway [Nitrospirillum amazonense]
MKLCRFGRRGEEKPGLVDADGVIRDLSSRIADITPAALTSDVLARLSAVDPASLPAVPGTPRYGVPVRGIGKIVAIGLNYEDHAIESNLPIPTEPVMFAKALSSLTGPNDEVMLPRNSTHSDWEVELGVVIGKTCRYVEEAQALDHVAGYVLANDVSERFNQKQRGTQWSKGKGHDTFCPVGPWLVTADEVGDPQDLGMWLDVNGQRMQTGNTRTMIFNVRQIIVYASQYITLFPGDLIITGTPPGVGEGKKPSPIFLKAGDVMDLGIAKLGTQRQQVVEWRHLGDEVLA